MARLAAVGVYSASGAASLRRLCVADLVATGQLAGAKCGAIQLKQKANVHNTLVNIG